LTDRLSFFFHLSVEKDESVALRLSKGRRMKNLLIQVFRASKGARAKRFKNLLRRKR